MGSNCLMPKVIHVTTNHPIHDPRIFKKECRSLINENYDVSFLVCMESGCTNGRESKFINLGVPQKSLIRRLFLQPKILLYLMRLEPQIVHFHDAELLPIMSLFVMLNSSKTKVIFDVHENFVESLKSQKRFFFSRIYERIFAIAEKKMEFILAEDSYKQFCKTEHLVIHNFALEAPKEGFIPWNERKNRIVYIGNITEFRGSLIMLKAFAMANLKEWELMLIGNTDTPEHLSFLKKEASELNVNLCLTGYVPIERATRLLADSKLGLALLQPIPNYIGSLPTKVFDYLLCKVPSLISNFPYYVDVFQDVPGIRLVDPLNTSAICNAIRDLAYHPQEYSRLSEEGYEYARKNFVWSIEEKKLLTYYSRILRT